MEPYESNSQCKGEKNMKPVRIILSVLAVTLVSAFALPSIAGDDPDNVLKYRKAVMKSIGGHMGAMAAIVKGQVSYPASHIALHAEGLNASSQLIADAFKANVKPTNKTRAKPDIWKEWDKFAAAAKATSTESAKLAQVAKGGDMAAIKAQFGALGKSCGGCHKPFRAKKKKK